MLLMWPPAPHCALEHRHTFTEFISKFQPTAIHRKRIQMPNDKQMAIRTLVVTAADEAFMPLLRGLVQSLHQWEPRPFTDLACLDLGLTRESRRWIEHFAAHVLEPGWDLPVDEKLRQEQPELRALTARPFLPRYFPGYDTYLWIDADAWVQERFALEWPVAAATAGQLAAAPQTHHTYLQTSENFSWRMQRMQAYFGQQSGSRLLWDTYFNAGVFALRSDAPHWALWAKWFDLGLRATDGKLCCDQTALNQAIWIEHLPVNPLPALCNWLCHLSLPRFDAVRKRFCEPTAPGHPIGILHLSANSKDANLELRGEGGTRSVSLRFYGAG
jgi:hypothetical protein